MKKLYTVVYSAQCSATVDVRAESEDEAIELAAKIPVQWIDCGDVNIDEVITNN